MLTRPATVLRLCSVFEPDPALLAKEDAASYDEIGGMQTHTAELTRCLDARGLPQRVFTSRLGGSSGSARWGERTEVRRTGLPIRVLRQLWALLAAPAVLRTPDVALVHAHQGEDVTVLLLALAAARRHRCPLVVTLHLSVRHTLRVTSLRTALLKVIGSYVERQAVRRAAAVLVLTAPARDHLLADGILPERVHVVPSGFAPALFAGHRRDPLPAVPRPRVLFLGRLAPQKAPLDLLAAFEAMTVEAQLVVVGDGPLRAAVEQYLAHSPVRARITLVGLVPHHEVPAYLEYADVFAMPSAYEELGSALVEAMAASLPLVANRVDGIPALVADGRRGLLVERGDTAGLARALDTLLADPGCARRLASEARRHVLEHYSWPALAARVHAVYASALLPKALEAAEESWAS